MSAVALYDGIGGGYADRRRPDPRIAAAIAAALGDAAGIVNVGAGAGSYESAGRTRLAIEPSEVMIRQRPRDTAPCVQASAEALPLVDGAFEAATAFLTLHHWPDRERGLTELARVARRRVVLLTWAPDAAPFWLTRDYFPEIMATDRRTFPDTPALSALLERAIGPTRVVPVAIPHDCTDGFLCAYWRRPEAYLDAGVRAGMSSFATLDAEAGLARLRDDLESGRWTARNGEVLGVAALDLGYRVVVCERG